MDTATDCRTGRLDLRDPNHVARVAALLRDLDL
jgi:hypothetical protein